MFSQYDELTAH